MKVYVLFGLIITFEVLGLRLPRMNTESANLVTGGLLQYERVFRQSSPASCSHYSFARTSEFRPQRPGSTMEGILPHGLLEAMFSRGVY